jgi:hypothetical protein
MKRNRVAVWLDVNDETIKWLKELRPRERAEVVRQSLSLFRDTLSGKVRGEVDENAVIVGEAVLSQIQLAFPNRDVDDELIQTILIRGIRNLKKEEEELERKQLLSCLGEV